MTMKRMRTEPVVVATAFLSVGKKDNGQSSEKEGDLQKKKKNKKKI